MKMRFLKKYKWYQWLELLGVIGMDIVFFVLFIINQRNLLWWMLPALFSLIPIAEIISPCCLWEMCMSYYDNDVYYYKDDLHWIEKAKNIGTIVLGTAVVFVAFYCILFPAPTQIIR